MYTERKINSGLIGALFLLAAVILFFAHTIPQKNRSEKLLADTTSAQEELTELGVVKEKPKDMILSDVEKNDLEQSIPDKMEQDKIILDLDSLSTKTDIIFNALTFNLSEEDQIPSINISASFQGSAQNIIRFLKMIEVNPRKFVVKDAGIARMDETTDGGINLVNLNATLKAFYRYE